MNRPVQSLPLRAIVLAAGRGERMRPLTDTTPKPLLPVRGRPMIEWHLEALARDGIEEVMVNTAWLEDQFPATLGDGRRFGLKLSYSMEGRDHGGALETAGGIAKVLPWLTEGGREAFWVVSGDIWAPDFRYDAALAQRFIASGLAAHLWLVPNPPFHPKGDFGLGMPRPDIGPEVAMGTSDPAVSRMTFANFALMRPALVADIVPGARTALGQRLHAAIGEGQISVQPYRGTWENVGTPQQLEALQQHAPHARGG